jgi:hypothetical protein
MAMTLAELKAQNAAADADQTAEATEVTDDLELDQGSTDDGQADTETDGDGQEGTGEVIEAWQAEDDPASNGGDKKFSDSDMAGMRRKLQAKLGEKDEELDRLKQEVQALKQGTQRPAQEAGKVPTLDGYDYDEAKYAAAMQAWVISQVSNVTKAQETQVRQSQHQHALQNQVENHYQRAAKLVKDRTIDPDLYRAADESFRKAIEFALPGNGDLVADQLIARLGDGSEKVTFYLGRNATERDVLKAKLMEDPSGISAAIHLGGLLKKVSSPVQKTTKAPAPAARAEGRESASSNAANFKRKYEKAKDTQTRFDIRREAKRAGLDTSKW